MRHYLLYICLLILLFHGSIAWGYEITSLPSNNTTGSVREIVWAAHNAVNENSYNNSNSQYFRDSTGAPASPAVTAEENAIHALAAAIKAQNRYIDRIDSSAVMDLPAGIANKGGSLDYTIIIKRLINIPDSGAFLEVCMSFEIPQNGRKIAFLGRRIPFSFSGGIKGDSRIELLGDQPIPLSSNINLNFKGDGGTYVAFDCNGFKSMGVKVEVEFSRNIFIPENADGSPDNSNTLKSTFTTTLSDWNDLIVDLNIPPFEVKGLKGVGFEVKNAVFDFSDTHNAPGIKFPKEYQSSYFGGGASVNLWRGFYIQEATIKLPKEFKGKGSTNRLTFAANDLLIDEQGVSSTFSVKNLLTLDSGDMNGWALSIDSLAVKLVANQLTQAGFKGKMNIPVLKENSGLDYSAVISTGGNYSFTISSQKPVEMSIWAAQLKLLPTSNITVAVVNDKFMPEANLTGTLSIVKGSNNDSETSKNSLVEIAGISFEHLVIRSVQPYIQLGSISFGAGDKSSNLGKFPLIINNIGLKTEADRAGISFNVIVNLMKSSDEGFGASGGFVIWGKRDEVSHNWKYQDIEVNSLGVNVEKKDAFRLKGDVLFFHGDSTYGRGFKGTLDATFGSSINLKATALFGSINDMRYWYADAMVNLSNGIPLCPSLSLYGFGGGVYHHMRQKGFNETKGSQVGATQSGIIYVPTPDVSLGLKASVSLGTTKKEVINGDATFEISFNSSGGLNQIGFEGNVYFITSEFTSAMSDVTNNSKSLANGNSQPAKTTNAERAQISGNIKLLFDNANSVFHGDIKVYANIAGGIIRGIGPGDLAGAAVIHFAPSEWYIYIGTPTTPIGLEFARVFKTKSYLMVGHNLPGSPPPPAKVSEILGGMDLNYMRDLNALGAGNGFAFGASLEVNTGDITFLIFYARLEAGVGFDIMLKDYGDAQCEGRSGKIGINGWYANGQAYAYVEGSVGIKVDLPFYSGKYEILKVGVAAILQAKGPNPLWMRGIVGGRYSILNGLVKGNCHFEFVLGEECKITNGNPLGGIKIISQVTPSSGSTDVDVFNSPQALFNMAVGKEFTVTDENSTPRTFRVKLDYFRLLLPDKTTIPGNVVWNQENEVAAFNNLDIFPSQKEITASVQVSFEEKVNDAWKVVMVNGQKVIESMENKFTSGIAPDYIPLSNVAYAYPIVNQYNFYKNEYNQGYIKLKKGQPYLFNAPPGFIQKGRMKTAAGNVPLFNFTYNNGMITYPLPQGLGYSSIYTFDLLNIPAQAAQAIDRNVQTVTSNTGLGNTDGSTAEVQTKKAEGSIETLQEKSLLTYYFRTSKYSTFNEKVNGMVISTGWRRPLRINVHELGVTLNGDEMFDKMETNWTEDITPVVQFEALFSETAWYNNIINPLIYNNYPLVASANIDWRDVSILGVPPSKAAYIRQYPNDRMLTEADLSGPDAYGTPDVAAFVYNTAHFIDQDFYNIRTKLATALARGVAMNEQGTRMLSGMFPGIKQGDYPLSVKYVLPGLNQVTSTKRIVINNPIPD